MAGGRKKDPPFTNLNKKGKRPVSVLFGECGGLGKKKAPEGLSLSLIAHCEHDMDINTN